MNRLLRSLSAAILVSVSALTLAASGREVIHASADLVQPLLPGMLAPDFTVRDVEGHPVAYKGSKLEKPVVLTFYRGGWCPYCNLHLSELRLVEKQLKAQGFDIWFISIDRPELLVETLSNPETGYTIYSDSSLDATRAFGLAFRVSDEMNERLLSYDIDLERASGENHHVLPAPATYIIGTDGMINFAYINPNYKIRLHPDVLLAAANAYQQNLDKRLVKQRQRATEK